MDNFCWVLKLSFNFLESIFRAKSECEQTKNRKLDLREMLTEAI